MHLLLVIILFIVGLILILKGGDFLVDSAIWIAKVTRVPEMIIGATIVSVATTLPEIMVSTIAVVRGVVANDPVQLAELTSLAVGNAVGSMLSNICLSLAFVLMARKLITDSKSFAVKSIYLMTITVLVYIFALGDNVINLIEGIILLLAFIIFMVINVLEAVQNNKNLKLESIDNVSVKDSAEAMIETPTEIIVKEKSGAIMIAMFFVGALGIGAGAWMLVEYGQKLAVMMGIPLQVVGITIVAIGTGLPEMVTSLKSVKKNKGNLGMGNIIGANIINSTLLLGLITVISGSGLPIDAITKNVALLVLIGITAILILPSIVFKRTFKWQGISMFIIYIVFLTYNVIAVLQ